MIELKLTAASKKIHTKKYDPGPLGPPTPDALAGPFLNRLTIS